MRTAPGQRPVDEPPPDPRERSRAKDSATLIAEDAPIVSGAELLDVRQQDAHQPGRNGNDAHGVGVALLEPSPVVALAVVGPLLRSDREALSEDEPPPSLFGEMAVDPSKRDCLSGTDARVVEDSEEGDQPTSAASIPRAHVRHCNQEYAGLRRRNDQARVYVVLGSDTLGLDPPQRVLCQLPQLDGVLDGGVQAAAAAAVRVPRCRAAVQGDRELMKDATGNRWVCQVREEKRSLTQPT